MVLNRIRHSLRCSLMRVADEAAARHYTRYEELAERHRHGLEDLDRGEIETILDNFEPRLIPGTTESHA